MNSVSEYIKALKVLTMQEQKKIGKFQTELTHCPVSGEEGYFFPWNKEISTYDISNFDSKDPSRLSKKDVESIIQNLEKSPYFKPEKPKCWKVAFPLLCLLLLALLILSIVFIAKSSLSGGSKTGYIILSLLLFSILVLVCLKVSVSISSRYRRQRKRDRHSQIKRILEEVNGGVLKGKRLRARMSKAGAYLAIEHDGTNCNYTQGGQKAYFTGNTEKETLNKRHTFHEDVSSQNSKQKPDDFVKDDKETKAKKDSNKNFDEEIMEENIQVKTNIQPPVSVAAKDSAFQESQV